MSVNSKQTESFLNATGVSMDNIMLVLATLVAVAIMLWSAWVTLSYYNQWASNKNDVTLFDVMWSATRSTILLCLVLNLVSK